MVNLKGAVAYLTVLTILAYAMWPRPETADANVSPVYVSDRTSRSIEKKVEEIPSQSIDFGTIKPQYIDELKGEKTVKEDYSIVDDELMKAIRTLESSGKYDDIGDKGERGAYQFLKGTWEDTTKMMYGRALDFSLAFDKKTSDEVAKFWAKYLESLCKKDYAEWNELDAHGKKRRIVALWNCGPRYSDDELSEMPRFTRNEHVRKYDKYVRGEYK